MSLPNVTITVENGALGTINFTDDGISGMILSGDAAPAGLALNTAKKIFSVEEAEAVGITAAYDTTNAVHAHRNISEFYQAGGNGLPLWIMVVANTETMEDICDKASVNKLAKTLLDAAQGEIRLLGITRMPDGDYEPTYVNGLDDDAYAALVKLDALLADYEAVYSPAVGIVEGRDFQGDAADLIDLREASLNRVACVIASGENAIKAEVHDKSASVGLLLGRLASDPVQRKASRKKTGALPITQAYLSDGTKVDEFAALADVHDAGYIAMRKFVRRTGFYFTGDPTATLITDDYAFISRRRVINKAIMIAYDTYVEELEDEILIDDEGKIHPGTIKEWQGKIDNQVNSQMTAEGEISAFSSFIDPDQNVISTNQVNVVLRITPVGYSTNIEVSLGFTNPALNQ